MPEWHKEDVAPVVPAIFCLALLIIVVLGPAYLLWLHRGHSPLSLPIPEPAVWPTVDVIVPVRNEAAWIRPKLGNLRELDYPRGLVRIWVVDGGSSDATVEYVKAAIAEDERFELLELQVGSKPAQLNAAMPRGTARWILVTDGDAWLPRGVLRQMVSCGEADPRLAAVGTAVEPFRAHRLERLHWRMLNRLRQSEDQRGFVSLVTGPCYLFRRSLLDRFPEDVVADDVHVTLMAAARGCRAGMVKVQVIESRSPRGIRELLLHKCRKADAYLREIFRFLPQVVGMAPPARQIVLWRAGQLVLLPLALVVGSAISVVWLMACLLPLVSPTALAVSVALALLGCRLIWRARPKALLVPALAALLVSALLSSLVAYPFSRQTACYPKVGSKAFARQEDTS